MVSDFERFLEGLTSSMGLPGAPTAPPPIRTQRPEPLPYSNATPQQQQAIQQASAGLPPDLVAQIAQLAAAPAAQQMPSPAINPNLMASTTMPMGYQQPARDTAPVQAPQPKPTDNPYAAKDGEGYVFVAYDTGTEEGEVTVAVPERYVPTLPAGTRVISEVIPASRRDDMAANNDLLEQQSDTVKNGIVPPKQVAVAKNPEILVVEDRQGNISTIYATEEVPQGSKVIRRGGGEQSGEKMVATGSPTVVGEMTDEQAAANRAQNTATVDAEGNIVEPDKEVRVLSIAELRAIDTPETTEMADRLEQSGLTEYRDDTAYIQDPETGRLTAMPMDEYLAQSEDANAPLPAMTTNIIRDEHGMNTEANELEAQGIYVIPDGKMAVKRNGTWTIVTAQENPANVDDVVYGGVSKPLEDKRIIGSGGDFIEGMKDLGGGVLPALAALDKPRRWTNEQMGSILYEQASGNDVNLPGWDPLTSFVLGAPGSDLKPGKTKLTSEEGSIGEWAKANPDKVIDLYENGYDANDDGVVDFTGGEAVFEYWVGQQNMLTRVVGEIAGDPLNIAAGGGGLLRRGATKVAGEAATTSIGRNLLSRGMNTTGRLLQLPDELMDAALSRTARGTYNTLTTEGVRTGLADKLATARITGKLFRDTDQVAMTKSQQDVDRSVSTLADQQALTRPMDNPPPTTGTVPPPTAPDVPPAPRTPDAPASGQPPTVVSSVDTPPIPREVIETLPPAQRALYENWDQQSLDIGGESPFSYREDGLPDAPNWGIATPRTDEDGRAVLELLEEDDYARRIVDETYVAVGKDLPDRWKFFADLHDPKARRFDAKEEELKARSIGQKQARGGKFDYPHKALSAVNEARYIIDDLIPDFKQAFPDREIPAYRFKNKAKTATLDSTENDDLLLETFIFGDADVSDAARRTLGTRAFNREDAHLAALIRTAGEYRTRYLDRLAGRVPEPRAAAPTPTISTEPLPTPRQAAPVEPEGIMDAPIVEPEPVRRGVGQEQQGDLRVPTERETAEARKQWNTENNRLRALMKENNVKPEWVSAYAQRKGHASAAGLTLDELTYLKNKLRTDAAGTKEMLEAFFEASAPKGVAGIESMAPADIRTTWGMKKRDLQKNLGIDKSLQPRSKPFDEEHVRGIVDNYVGERMDPILLKRGKDGNAYVVAGHNRLEAARRLNVDVPVRYTDASGDDLLRLSRETNMQNLGMSNANIAEDVRRMVDEGKSFEEIGRALKLSPDGIAKTPATMAERYYNYSFLNPDSNLARLTDQGILPMEISANAGRGIRNGALDQAEVQALAFRVSDNRLNPKKFDDILRRAIKRSEEGKSQQMGGMFEGMNVSDNLKAAEDEVDDLWRQWTKTHDDLRLANDSPVRSRTEIARLEAERARLADELDIPDAKIGMRNPTPEGYLSRDYQVDEGAAAATRTAPEFDNSGPLVDEMLDEDGNPIISAAQRMRDSGASPLFSQRQTPETRWAPRAVNQRGPTTAAVAVYGHPMGQWEFPSLNLDSISSRVNKKVANPFYKGESEFLSPRANTQRPSAQSRDADYWADTSRAPESEVRIVRGRVVTENDWDAHILSQRFDDGEQILDRWSRLADEYEGRGLTAEQADVRAADQVMADWGEQVIKDYDAKHGTSYHEKYVEEYERVTTTGKKEDRLEGTHAQIVATQRAIGGTNKATTIYDDYLGIMREMTLYNVLSGPRYIMTQLIGNTITAMITGNFGIIPRAIGEYKSSYQQMSGVNNDWVMKMLGGIGDGELSERTLRKGIRELEGEPRMILFDGTDRMMREWNIGTERGDIFNVVRDEVTEVGAPTKLHNLRLGSMQIGKRVDGVFANRAVRDMANAWDLSYRKAMYGHMLQQNNAGARIHMRNRMMETMPSSLPTSEFNRMWDEIPDFFGSDRIRQVFGEVDAKWADRMARDWQSAIRKMDMDARDKTYKLFFSGYERNADKALRRVFFFHYWMSRATPLYTEALMRNPGVMNAYVKMLAEIKEQEEEGRFGPAVNGFLNFLSTPFGFNIFIRPDAFLQTVFALDDGSDFAPEGETFLGTLMRKSPLMINPLIDSAANLLGIQGDTFAPDPLMLGQWSNLSTNGTNFVKSHMGDEVGSPTRNSYSDLLAWVREKTSGYVGLPKIEMTDSTQYARRDVNYFIMEVAEERGLDPMGVEAMAAMDDPESSLYKEAFNRYSEMKLWEHGLRFFPITAPLYPKVRQERGDETRYIINSAEPGSSEREEAMNQRAIAQTSDPEARTLALQQKEYTSLGKPDERDAYSTYNGIQYGGLKEPVVIDGVAVDDWVLFGMTEDERKTAADAWAEQTGNTDKVESVRELRKEYRESHPEYAAYVDWRGQVSDHEGGAIEYWADLAEGNPNAERYLSNVEEGEPGDVEMNLTSVTAYMQYMGIRPTIYDPNPISTNNGQGQPYNPAGASDSNGEWGSGSSTTIEEDLVAYDEEMTAWNAKYGDLRNMTPPMRDATMQIARDNGDEMPYLSAKAKDYMKWVDAQTPGTDTSIPAYEKWKEGQDADVEKKPGDQSPEDREKAKRKESSYAPTQPQYAGGINELLSLLQF